MKKLYLPFLLITLFINVGLLTSCQSKRHGSISPLSDNVLLTSKTSQKQNPLFDNLIRYYSFDNHLIGLNDHCIERKVSFNRYTVAYNHDLTPFNPGQARFESGVNGKAVYIETGKCSSGGKSAQNLLPEDFLKTLKAKGSCKITFSEQGLQKLPTINVSISGRGSSLVSDALKVPYAKQGAFSCYLKGKGTLVLAVINAQNGKILNEKQVPLAGKLSRESLNFEFPVADAVAKTSSLTIKITSKTNNSYQLTAPMLEVYHGYSGRNTVSSWILPEQSRGGEVLQVGYLKNVSSGTIFFRAKLKGKCGWRVLFHIGNDPGWQPALRLDARNDKYLSLQSAAGRINSKVIENLRKWHDYAVSWQDGKVVVYVDGKPVIHASGITLKANQAMTLGGVLRNSSPGIKSNALYDDFAIWNTSLTARDITSLSVNIKQFSTLDSRLTLADQQPVYTFGQDEQVHEWPLCLKNRSTQTADNIRITYSIPGVFNQQCFLKTIPPMNQNMFKFTWEPARLIPGQYTMHIDIESTVNKIHYSVPLTIIKARCPKQNLQIATWGGINKSYYQMGLTVAGLSGGSKLSLASQVTAANNARLYSQLRQTLRLDQAPQALCFKNALGHKAAPDYNEPKTINFINKSVSHFTNILSRFPDIRYLIINTEHITRQSHDFRAANIKSVKKRFGLDMQTWMVKDKRNFWQAIHPQGRLSSRFGKVAIPNDGIIKPDMPFYTYHRWWHSSNAGTEVALNSLIIRDVRQKASWVNTIIEPILRAPSLRSYKQHHISEEWFYYPNPAVAVHVQEKLAAMSRGNNAVVSGMPQFLFKPNMAAPYGGMPAPHMFREVVWHCISRPINLLMYWNIWKVVENTNKKKMKTQSEIDQVLGHKPNWQEATQKIKVKGENSSLFLWIPELKKEVSRLHNTVIHPMGGLLPYWKNKQRKIAVYQSFAGELFNNIRWQGRSPLAAFITSLTMPYDIILDQDFEKHKHLLEQYNVVLIPESPVLYQPAYKQLEPFLKRGGMLVTDAMFLPQLKGTIRYNATQQKQQHATQKLIEKEKELLALYKSDEHPLYIEGMEQAAKDVDRKTVADKQILDKIVKMTSYPVRAENLNIFFNLLEAEHANYLAVVNDLRVPGTYYGHFGRVREKGIAQRVMFNYKPSLGRVAYHLQKSTRINLANSCFQLDLPAAGGAVIIFLPEEIAHLKADLNTNKEQVTIHATLIGKSGRNVPGLIPAKISITNPDGTTNGFSHYTTLKNGRLTFSMPIAYNQPNGNYKIKIKELASGKSKTITWQY